MSECWYDPAGLRIMGADGRPTTRNRLNPWEAGLLDALRAGWTDTASAWRACYGYAAPMTESRRLMVRKRIARLKAKGAVIESTGHVGPHMAQYRLAMPVGNPARVMGLRLGRGGVK